MPRPGPTKSERRIKSDLLVVRPYAIGIVVIGVVALVSIVSALVAVVDVTTVSIIIGSITMFATQVIGYLLVLAKQIESDHRVNSRMDELLEVSGLNEYIAGKQQGIKDATDQPINQR